MILKETFYKIVNKEEGEGTYKVVIQLNPDDAIFEGHFPNNPVTPGVAQLEIIKELLSDKYQRAISLQSISNCKYLAILNPLIDQEVAFSMNIREEEELLKVTTQISNGTTIFTKAAGIYY